MFMSAIENFRTIFRCANLYHQSEHPRSCSPLPSSIITQREMTALSTSNTVRLSTRSAIRSTQCLPHQKQPCSSPPCRLFPPITSHAIHTQTLRNPRKHPFKRPGNYSQTVLPLLLPCPNS